MRKTIFEQLRRLFFSEIVYHTKEFSTISSGSIQTREEVSKKNTFQELHFRQSLHIIITSKVTQLSPVKKSLFTALFTLQPRACEAS